MMITRCLLDKGSRVRVGPFEGVSGIVKSAHEWIDPLGRHCRRRMVILDEEYLGEKLWNFALSDLTSADNGEGK